MTGRRAFILGALASLLGSATAVGDPLPQPLPVTEVAAGIFVAVGPHELATPQNADHIANAGFIIGNEAVAVIDTGGSVIVGRQLLAAIRLKTRKPIRYVVNTHDHPDHILGNAAFSDERAVIVSHYRLPEALAARGSTYLDATRTLIGEAAFAGTRLVPPTLLIRDRLAVDLGNRPLLLEAWPVAHTDTDMTVFDERSGTWFLGDLLFSVHVPALDGSLKGWLTVIGDLRKRAASRAVPGHGPAALSWPEALDPMERYLRALFADIKTSVREGRTMREAAARAAQSERDRWLLFDDFNARNATAAFHELEWDSP